MKIRRVGQKFFYADVRTDRYDETNSRFSWFYESAQTHVKYIREYDPGGIARKNELKDSWKYFLKCVPRIYGDWNCVCRVPWGVQLTMSSIILQIILLEYGVSGRDRIIC
jgi:hypothetical protein